MSKPRSDLAGLFAELKRRRVVRVLLAYGAFAFVAAEGADIFFPALGLPDWTVNAVAVLALAGAPVALVLSWVFDITPEGIRRTEPLPSGVVGRVPPTRDENAPASPENSIAVLPFWNRSGESDNDFFADGITEELIHALTRAPGLAVAARTSSFAIKGEMLDARDVGRRLGVSRLVEGSVLALSPKLRLSVQLVDTERGHSQWGDLYEGDLHDAPTVQQQVVEEILERMGSGPTVASEDPHLTTKSADAYQLNMRGRYHWNRRTEADLEKAADYFERAISLDSDYANAYCGLADTHSILLDYGLRAPSASLPAARLAADRAVELAPSLAEAWASKAMVHLFSWEWVEAEREFRRALELNPSYEIVRQRYALYLAWMGRHDEALEQVERALTLDPLNLAISATLGWVLYYARRYEDAIVRLDDTLKMDPGFSPALAAQGQSLAAVGDFPQAVERHERALERSGRSAASVALLAYANGRAGRLEEAESAAKQLVGKAAQRYVSPYYMALPPLGRELAPDVIAELNRGLDERAPTLVYIGVEPIFDPLRNDPAFVRILDGLDLPSNGSDRS